MSAIAERGFKEFRQLYDWLSSVWALILIVPGMVLIFDPDNFLNIVSIAVKALAGTLPYILIAVLMLSYLRASGAEAVVARAFKGRESRMILLAAVFGGLAPFCSCEVIPFIAGLLALGAPLSAVMAFWLASPLIDPATFMVTAGALGWHFAVGKTVAAVMLGLIGGFAMKLIVSSGAFSDPLLPRSSGGGCRKSSPFDGQPVWKFWKEQERREVFRSELATNGLFLLKWLAFAYVLEALLITYVPAELIAKAVGGDGFLPIVIGALVGAPAYLNSYAAPALVQGLMEQGMSNGSAMAFMISGSVSSIPAMAAVWSLVKRQVFVAYMLLGVGGAILLGSLFSLVMAMIQA
ncbi:MAG: permease [Methyloligellaceae bacterium]